MSESSDYARHCIEALIERSRQWEGLLADLPKWPSSSDDEEGVDLWSGHVNALIEAAEFVEQLVHELDAVLSGEAAAADADELEPLGAVLATMEAQAEACEERGWARSYLRTLAVGVREDVERRLGAKVKV